MTGTRDVMIAVKGLRSQFGDHVIHEDLNLTVERGEVLAVVGGSGTGKTVLLNTIIGLKQPEGGSVEMFGRDMAGLSEAEAADVERRTGVLFQSGALFSSLTVLQNVAAPMIEHTRLPKAMIDEIAEMKIAMVGLKPEAHHLKPAELSGGMKQRVGIARAFSIEPKMLLLDEPFGALDALTRGSIQDELIGIVEATQQTVFMITHDVDEAILLADRIVLMTNGPRAKIAEIVVNPLARPRVRETLHQQPAFYTLRNHLVDFLVKRSREFQPGPGWDAKNPPLVHPGQSSQPA